MYTTYATLAPFLRPEYPKYQASEASRGWTFAYRWHDDDIPGFSRPVVGLAWGDGTAVTILPITSIEFTPALDNSGVNEMTISTVYQVAGGGVSISTTLEEERYGLRYVAITKPLIQHPAFQKGGTSDLYSTNVTSGGITATPLAFCMMWENESLTATQEGGSVVAVRGAGKFYQRTKDGQITGSLITVPAGAAQAYVKLRIMGFDSYTDYYPVWQKIGTYRGTEAPSSDGVGAYVPSPPADGRPSGYEWVKSGDSVERIGNQARWQRTEEWTGGKVYFDKTTLDPKGDKDIPNF